MRSLISLAFYALILAAISCRNSKNDSVRTAETKNEEKADNHVVNGDVADFLVTIADARMMDIEEGKDAVRKGTSPVIRRYGKLMIKDQNLLLLKIKKLASDRNITLPVTISNRKKDGLDDQQKRTGKDFDEKFVKMMTIDHERDIRDFKSAADLNDKGVQAFASAYLPMIQLHLDKIKKIKEDLN